MTEKNHADTQQALLDSCRDAIVQEGVENLSLRQLAQNAGKSTSPIFQYFGGKNQLLLATLKDAVETERVRHKALLEYYSGMEMRPHILSCVAQAYLIHQIRQPTMLVCMEALYKPREFPGSATLLAEWVDLQQAFWGELLGSERSHLTEPLVAYILAEQAYAGALPKDPLFTLLLNEGLNGFFLPEDVKSDPVGAWAIEKFWKPEDLGAEGQGRLDRLPPAMRDFVVQLSVRIIEKGLCGLTLRQEAREAQISPSQVVYHFGDTSACIRTAIWHALLTILPQKFARSDYAGLSSWQEMLVGMISRDPVEAGGGGYVQFMRIMGQLGIAARHDPEFVPVLRALRIYEGQGLLNRLSRHPDFQDDSFFGVARMTLCLKGMAMINEALERGGDGAQERQRVQSVIDLLSGTSGPSAPA
ncbi:TetR family transcriptional regulator [Altericroceibacterium endophyticum]|uniref:TetR family transcriptional regulator n=1 Tax=Altericroceibacterium endophyticum TaxID=1808508 RepID=A0A6I4T9R9_9SPHN|nr:TetR family transcriptional regulator [Altericroceibacterium endophyticum]MXO66763.1 TetR family transcriptional regulator [Altericroceibacterium endophyticum]